MREGVFDVKISSSVRLLMRSGLVVVNDGLEGSDGRGSWRLRGELGGGGSLGENGMVGLLRLMGVKPCVGVGVHSSAEISASQRVSSAASF